MVRKICFQALFIIVLLAAGVPGLVDPQPAVSQETVKGRTVIGAVLDLTGQGAARGRHARDALLLEESRINQGRPASLARIQLVLIDSEGKTEGATKAVKRLAGEFGATAIIGPAEREATLAAALEAEKARIPLASLIAPEALLRPVRKWVFSTAHPVSLAVGRVFSHISLRGFRRIAILASGKALGREGREILSGLAPDRGLSILLNERFSEKEHNFLPFLQKSHLRGAQAFLHWSNGASRLALARARLALDIRIPIYLSMVASKSYELEGRGRAVEGLMFPVPRVFAAELLTENTPGREQIQKFRSDFRRRFGQLPDGLAGYAADAFRIIGKTLAGSPRRGLVRRRIETMGTFQGLTGIFRITPSDHNGLNPHSLVLVKIKEGKWALAETKK